VSAVSLAVERAHVAIGRTINRLFTPIGGDDEIAVWDRHWSARIEAAEAMGHVPEHDVEGKRRIYDHIGDTIQHCAGGLDGKTVAEFDCGSGYTTLRLAERGARPVLIDASEAALRYARFLADFLGCRQGPTYVQTDLLEDRGLGPFDVCFNSGVLEHYSPDVAAAMLRLMARSTRPGGVVIVILPNLLAPVMLARMMRSRSKGSELFYSQWRLERTFASAGLPRSRGGYLAAHLPIDAPLWAHRLLAPVLARPSLGFLSPLFFRWARISER
jgi:2-polyprenyl-3-methyl-5-hydroxy-6-metoxy-1,4-benzoquinol methylase